MKSSVQTIINSGLYNAERLVSKINSMWLRDDLTDAECAELIAAAYDNARDINQIDVMQKLTELQDNLFDLTNRVYVLEHKDDPEPEPVPEYPIYEPGMITAKGSIVRFDYDNDGDYDLLLYDGGRASTSLSPGKIAGWYVVDAEGNVLGTYYKGEFTPVNNEQEEQSEPSDPGTPSDGESEGDGE